LQQRKFAKNSNSQQITTKIRSFDISKNYI
jgi:hypothetical protein